MNLADVLPTIRNFSPSQKQALIEHLQADLASPPPLAEFLQTRSQQNNLSWDLSDAAIARRNEATLILLNKWESEGDEQEQTETWEFLQNALDEEFTGS